MLMGAMLVDDRNVAEEEAHVGALPQDCARPGKDGVDGLV